MIAGVIDVTTTEVADMLIGGVLPATEDRFGAIIRTRVPYVGSVGALDMVNFGARETVPERYRGRKLHVHNPQVTLMRTTAEENARDRPLDRRAAQPDGRAGAFLPARTRRLRPRRGRPAVLRPGGRRRSVPRAGADGQADQQPALILRVRRNINDPEFAAAIVAAFRSLIGRGGERRRATR